jgi:hypothetical protein
MSAVSHAGGVRHGAEPDPHIVELSKLMLARAPELGQALADRLFREIDAYRDGTVVTKDEVQASCEANLTFVFHALSGHGDVDVSPAENAGTARALVGLPLPALMTAYRIGFRFMWEETLAVGRAAGVPTESILDATARVFLAQDTFTQAMANAYRQQLTQQILEQEEERSALVEALLSRRITDSQSLWEAADLLRLPTTGPYVVVAAELPAIGKIGLPAIENKLAARDIRSAWRLLPDLHMGKIRSQVLRRLKELPTAESTILLDTFQAWMQEGGSANDTATKIFCHPNTVRHRLRRIEELTDRSLSRPLDIAELCLAFEVEQRLP